MKKVLKKTKWLQFLIAITAISIPVASGGLLVVACSNTDEQIKKQKADINEFAARTESLVKNSSYSNNVIYTVFNSEDIDLFNNDFIEFQTPDNRNIYDFSSHATIDSLNSTKIVIVFITITNKQNPTIVRNISFNFSEFAKENSPQDETIISLHNVMSKMKLVKKPGNRRVIDAIQDINVPTFNPLVNDIFSVEVPADLQPALANFTPAATATVNDESNTSVNVSMQLTSKTFSNVSKTTNYAIDGFIYISPIDLEREKLTAFVNNLSLTVIDHNLTLYDAMLKVNTSGFNVLNNPVFSISNPASAVNYDLTATATANSLITMEVTLNITSRTYKDVNATKNFSIGDFVDGRISETQKINDLKDKFTIAKRTDAIGKSLTVAEALNEISAPTFDVYNNKVFTVADADVFELKQFKLTVTAQEQSITSIAVHFTLTSITYTDINAEKDFTLNSFIDPKVNEANKIKTLINKVTVKKSALELTLKDALNIIQGDDFNVLDNTVFTTIYQNEDITPYIFSLASSHEKTTTQIEIAIKITSKTYSELSETKAFTIDGFIANDVEIEAEKAELAQLMQNLTIMKKSTADTIGTVVAVETINGAGFDALNNTIFTLIPSFDTVKFSAKAQAAKISDTSLSVTITLTSIKFPSEVTDNKSKDLEGFPIDDPKTLETNRFNKFISDLAVAKIANDYTVDVALASIAEPAFNVLSNDVFTVSPAETAASFNLSATAIKATDNSIDVRFTITSKIYSDLTKIKVLPLVGFVNPKAEETQKLEALIAIITITKNSAGASLTVSEALTLVAAPDFDPLNNAVVNVSHQTQVAEFDYIMTASKLNDNEIKFVLTLTSKTWNDVSKKIEVEINGFDNQEILERQKLDTLMSKVVVTKTTTTLTANEALAEINKTDFNLFNNTIFTIDPIADVQEFNVTLTDKIIQNSNDIQLTFKFASKTFPATVFATKDFTLASFKTEFDTETEKLTALMNTYALEKQTNNLTANDAINFINATDFNIYQNEVYTITPTAADEGFITTISATKESDSSISIKLTLTSKLLAAVTQTKDFTLTNFKTELDAETEKLTALMNTYAFEKRTNNQSADDAINLINATDFNIYQNEVYTITPIAADEGFITTISASKANDSSISISLTLTSKLLAAVTQTKSFTLENFTTTPITEGVSGTGINKIWTDANVGTVYVGTAETYTLSGKNFYGDPYTLNPFQDYGAEELALMQAHATWPQIKQLIASSRPVSGTPNLDAYLPSAGTPITFTDSIKSSLDLPNNVKRFISIIDEPKYNEFFYYRNAVYSYREFLKAIAKYPRILAEVNLDASFIRDNSDLKVNGVLSPEKALSYVAKLEIATMFSHYMQETGANMGVFSTKESSEANRPKQIPWNSNYDISFNEPATTFTNYDLTSAASTQGITLANQTEMIANPTTKLQGTEKQALYWVTEAEFTKDDTTEAARQRYTDWDLATKPWTAAAFPPPIGDDGISTVSYIGRGAKQISYNSNYGSASRVFFGNDEAEVLLKNPSRVAKEGWLAIGTAVMFYMTPVGNKPSMHDAITGAWEPTSEQQIDNKWKPGFGLSINIINGGLELNADGNEANQKYQALNRQFYFARNTAALGILNFAMSSYFDNAGYSQTLFSKSSVATVATGWTVRSWGTLGVSLLDTDTGAGFKVNFPGDYYRAWQAYQTSTFIEDLGLTGLSEVAIFATKSADWKAGKNPTYTKVGPSYDWKNK